MAIDTKKVTESANVLLELPSRHLSVLVELLFSTLDEFEQQDVAEAIGNNSEAKLTDTQFTEEKMAKRFQECDELEAELQAALEQSNECEND